jgi:hypothetical protein
MYTNIELISQNLVSSGIPQGRQRWNPDPTVGGGGYFTSVSLSISSRSAKWISHCFNIV